MEDAAGQGRERACVCHLRRQDTGGGGRRGDLATAVALRSVPGIGPVKSERFAGEVLEIVGRHAERVE